MEKSNKKIRGEIALFLLMLLSPFLGRAQTPDNDPGWVLYLEDQFDQGQVDGSIWGFDDWKRTTGNYLNDDGDCIDYDMKAYRTLPGEGYDNFRFDNSGTGTMSLVVHEEHTSEYADFRCDDPITTALLDRDYTAPSWLKSIDEYKYGYFEIRCRLPELAIGETNKGIGANFWLWSEGASNYNPNVAYSEIDIFEFTWDSKTQTNHALGSNSHFQWVWDPKPTRTPKDEHFQVFFNNEAFHTFGCIWTPDKIEYYLDGVLHHESFNNPADMTEMKMIIDLNVFVSGSQIDGSTVLEYVYDVDYVRIYHMEMDCDTDLNQCNFDFTNHDHKVKKSITLGGPDCLAKVNHGEKESLRATDYILLNEGFEVELGGEIIIDNTTCHEYN